MDVSTTNAHRQSMLPVTALLEPVTGLTVVTMPSWSCLVKRFTSRCSFSANSHSSKAPAWQQSNKTQFDIETPDLVMCGSLLWNLPFTQVWCHNNTFVWNPFGIHNSSLSLHTSLAEFLVGGFGRVAVDPERSLPTPATEAGGTEQQSSICAHRQEKL